MGDLINAGICVSEDSIRKETAAGPFSFRRSIVGRSVGLMILFAVLALCGCGGGGSDSAPTFHALAITNSPLPNSPIAISMSTVMSQVDCYPGSTVQLYGTDTVFAQGSSTPSTTDATSKMQWTSSIPSVATVAAGLVTCITQGTTQITAMIANESCDASGSGAPCNAGPMPVTVGLTKHTLTLSPISVSLHSGQSQQMTVLLLQKQLLALRPAKTSPQPHSPFPAICQRSSWVVRITHLTIQARLRPETWWPKAVGAP